MDKRIVEAEILCLTADILMGKVSKEEIDRVTRLTIENNCYGILLREFCSVTKTLTSKPESEE